MYWDWMDLMAILGALYSINDNTIVHRGWTAHYLIMPAFHSLRSDLSGNGIPDWTWLPGPDFT